MPKYLVLVSAGTMVRQAERETNYEYGEVIEYGEIIRFG
jgi:hypothetical protein